jgi:hypothetical protein
LIKKIIPANGTFPCLFILPGCEATTLFAFVGVAPQPAKGGGKIWGNQKKGGNAPFF